MHENKTHETKVLYKYIYKTWVLIIILPALSMSMIKLNINGNYELLYILIDI